MTETNRATKVEPTAVPELKAAHGDELYQLLEEDVDSGEPLRIIFRKPGRNDLNRMSEKMMQKKTLSGMERLCFDTVVQPSSERLRQVFDTRPALPLTLATKIMEAAGSGADFGLTRL